MFINMAILPINWCIWSDQFILIRIHISFNVKYECTDYSLLFFINDSARLIFLSTVSIIRCYFHTLFYWNVYLLQTKEKWKKIITSLLLANDGNHDWTVLRICHNIFELQYILLHIATTTYKNRSPKFH